MVSNSYVLDALSRLVESLGRALSAVDREAKKQSRAQSAGFCEDSWLVLAWRETTPETRRKHSPGLEEESRVWRREAIFVEIVSRNTRPALFLSVSGTSKARFSFCFVSVFEAHCVFGRSLSLAGLSWIVSVSVDEIEGIEKGVSDTRTDSRTFQQKSVLT
ncbi:MAG: uncharacterized protein A8A55_2585 [Amphiamblys sp. WSBS2006]|nr:MAG: uncharacterized protein A8A55_2585 [Amphiamblys sp. WSBS2006]